MKSLTSVITAEIKSRLAPAFYCSDYGCFTSFRRQQEQQEQQEQQQEHRQPM